MFPLARVLHPGDYFISMGEKTAANPTTESASTPSIAQADVVSRNSSSNLGLVDEVFSLFKVYLTSQLQEKGKQFERSAKSKTVRGEFCGWAIY